MDWTLHWKYKRIETNQMPSKQPKTSELINEKKLQNPDKKLPLGRAVTVVLVLSLIGLLVWGMSENIQGRVQEGPAPDFSLTSFEGETISLSDLKGQVVVLNFWASWCPPCREEAPYLERIWREYQDKGVFFIGVDYVDIEPEAVAYIDEFDITYFNGPDLRTSISQAYQIQGVPETYFISKSGEIAHVHVGPLVPPDLETLIEELLAEPSP
jgi:cytochrome c biogenesis protein CcmG/thiol:disulfide interchange protein DsbE